MLGSDYSTAKFLVKESKKTKHIHLHIFELFFFRFKIRSWIRVKRGVSFRVRIPGLD